MEYSKDKWDRILDKLIASTRSPRGRFSAKAIYPLLEKKLFTNKPRRLFLRRAIAIAVVIAALCIPVWLVYKHTVAEQMMHIYARSEMKTVHLPDGTSVTLNHFSTLTLAKAFRKDKRDVILDGEAYFEVAKDHKHPFTVKTRNMDVQVLGTHFDVNAYRRNAEVKTMLYEGTVAVRCNEKSALLKPGEMAVYNKGNHTLRQKAIHDMSDYISWLKGQYIFNNSSINDVAAELSNSFGVNIVIPDKHLQQFHITARFCHGENLTTILTILHEAGYFEYSVDRNRITLCPKVK
jgi:transmembrane sensor